jgi:hypothetical protein
LHHSVVASIQRKKATREDYPGEGPVEIADAYRELSRPAFAFWVRLQVAESKELVGGRKKLAKKLKISVRRMRRWTIELESKGYITSARYRPAPEKFLIKRRGIIRAKHEFQRY